MIVFREPELSSEATVVDPAGNIAVPLIGELNVFGMRPSEVAQIIQTNLNARYLRNADVSVSLVKSGGYTFTVEGEVKKPGTYDIPGKATLLQAVAIGQGVTERAKLTDVIVFRTVNGQRYAARFDLKEIRAARSPDPELQPGDTIVVGYSVAKQIYRDIITALPGVAGIFVALNQN